MKKFLTLSLLAAASLQVQAQSADRLITDQQNQRELGVNKTFRSLSGKTAKSTAGGSRLYNYPELLGVSNQAVLSNTTLPYQWGTGDILGIYSDGAGGLVADTIFLSSYGMVLDPTWSKFNDPFNYPGEVELTRSNAYKLDSVYAYGVYGRNSAKTSVVDTLIWSALYGNGSGTNIPIYMFTSGDTVRFGGVSYDSSTYTATSAGGPAVLTYKMPLTVASLNDTDESGFNRFGWAPGLNVPAGNLLGVTVTFKSGDTYIPYQDTAFVGSLDANEPFRFNMFRPLFVYETNAAGTEVGTYSPGNYNAGIRKFLPDEGSWKGEYIPLWAYSQTQSQWPYMDFKISCATCAPVSVKNTAANFELGTARPNPAQAEFTVPVTLKAAAAVSVTLTNPMGQVVATQNLGKVAAGQTATAVFNTSALSNGIYFYTVEVGGERTTNRVVVAH